MFLYRFACSDVFISVDYLLIEFILVDSFIIFTTYSKFKVLTCLRIFNRENLCFIFLIIRVNIFVLLISKMGLLVKHVFFEFKVAIFLFIKHSWEFIINKFFCTVDVEKLLHPEHHLFVVSITVKFGSNFSLSTRSDVNK